MIRNILAALSFVAAVVFAISANVSVFVKRELYSPQAFTEHTANLVGNADVRDSLSNAIAEQVVTQVPPLGPFEGLVATGVSAVVGTAEFRDVFNEALSSVQQQLIAGNDVITLDLGAAAEPILREITSDIPFADAILDNVLPTIQGVLTVTVLTRQEAPEVWDWVERGEQAATWSVVLTIVFLGLGLALITRHWIGVAAAGGSIAIAALISFLTGFGSRTALRGQFAPGLEQRTFEAVYREFAGAFNTQTFVLLAFGVVVLVAGLGAELVATQIRHRSRDGESGPSENRRVPVAATAGGSGGSSPASPSGAPSAPPMLTNDDRRPGPPLLDG